MTNTLSIAFNLPDYKNFNLEHVDQNINCIIDTNKEQISQLLSQKNYTWQNTILPINALNNKLNKIWGIVSHLNSVCNSNKLREVYEYNLQKVSDYYVQQSQNKQLFKAVQYIQKTEQLNAIQLKIIDDSIKSFKLSGIDLEQSLQQRLQQISSRLAELNANFSNNILDSTLKWSLACSKEELAGIPEDMQALMNAKAIDANMGTDKYLLTLDAPTYISTITYAENRQIREFIYKGYSTIASDRFSVPTQNPNTDTFLNQTSEKEQRTNISNFDNSPIMREILQLKQEKAHILGFSNYADLSIETKMAESSHQVIEFLTDLVHTAKPYGYKQLQELQEYARDTLGIEDVKPWDLAFVSEKLKKPKFHITEEEIKQYFQIDHVLSGLFAIIDKLFAVQLQEIESKNKWHDDVRLFQVQEQGIILGYFYLDLYARDNKKSGAWMDGIVDRFLNTDNELELPVANLVCNFMPKVNGKSLLTHDEVITLFHEMGHGLQHLLTRIDYLDASGINGIEWDAVELPSQMMENFCWSRQGLKLISKHVQTNQTLSDELIDKMLAAKNFGAALFVLRQLEFGLFDMLLHKDNNSVEETINKARQQASIILPPEYNRFANSFSHIFAGGYSAGYYSYMWADVLSSDAFAYFDEYGVLSEYIGKKFHDTVLSQGGSKPAMDVYIEFRGRKPDSSALLKQYGLYLN